MSDYSGQRRMPSSDLLRQLHGTELPGPIRPAEAQPRRNPVAVSELREVCEHLHDWVNPDPEKGKHRKLLSLTALGKVVWTDGVDYTAEMLWVWGLLRHIAGHRRFPEYRHCPYPPGETMAALDRVVNWCNEQLAVETASEIEDHTTSPELAALPELVAVADIARHLNLTEDKVRGALIRYEGNHPGCFVETDTPRKNEPRKLYRRDEIEPVLQKLRKQKPPE
jgi:hypothetical protein